MSSSVGHCLWQIYRPSTLLRHNSVNPQQCIPPWYIRNHLAFLADIWPVSHQRSRGPQQAATIYSNGKSVVVAFVDFGLFRTNMCRVLSTRAFNCEVIHTQFRDKSINRRKHFTVFVMRCLNQFL